MKFCDHCRVHIAGERTHCPLCQAPLASGGETTPEVFPHVDTLYRKHSLFFRILIFVAVALCVSTLVLNFIWTPRRWWSLFVVAGVACMCLSLGVALRKRRNLPKNILWQLVLVCLLSILWDYFTGWRGWSVTLVLPICCISALALISLLALFSNYSLHEQTMYIFMCGLFGLTPIITLCLRVPGFLLPSALCIIISACALAACILFDSHHTLSEIRRKLHL